VGGDGGDPVVQQMLTSTAQENRKGLDSGLDAAIGIAWLEAATCLVDALLHEARNPLNALAIHLEILTEKVRAAPVPMASAEKNLRIMREQVYRVDAILRRFVEFIAPRQSGETEVKLSELSQSALEVLGHQIRKRHLRLTSRIEPDLFVAVRDGSTACFLVLQPILRSINRLEPHSELTVSLKRFGPTVGSWGTKGTCFYVL
jgi:signal transduction histidine kinase